MKFSQILRNILADGESLTGTSWLVAWAYILFGCLAISVGFAIFINPYNIVPGGVYGLSIVLHNIFPSIQVGYFGYMFDIPLLVISLLLLGSKVGARTIVAVVLTPFLMNTIEAAIYPTHEALRNLDPTQLLNGAVNMTDHLMLTTIIGSALIGLGCGLVVRGGATSGGTDVIGMIIQKYFHIPFSNAILMCDGFVVFCGLIVIGFGIGIDSSVSDSPSWLLSFYSLIAIYIMSRTIAYVISGSANDKIIFVISNQDLSSLNSYILKDLDKTATCIKSSGLYTGEDKTMLFFVVGRREVMGVKQQVKIADPRAFVVVTDAYDIYGEGFKPLPSKDDINPE